MGMEPVEIDTMGNQDNAVGSKPVGRDQAVAGGLADGHDPVGSPAGDSVHNDICWVEKIPFEVVRGYLRNMREGFVHRGAMAGENDWGCNSKPGSECNG